MTILPSTASLLLRQVRLNVSPPASTLFESRAIFSEVQSRFGSISAFISQRNDPVLDRLLRSGPRPTTSSSHPNPQTILVTFDRPASKNSALSSSPLVVSCGGELFPSAQELDPYNARGLQGRHHPPRRSFTCHIEEEKDPTIYQLLAAKHPYRGPFRIDTLQISYGDLIKSRTALEEMADVMQTERTSTDGVRTKKQGCCDEVPQTEPLKGFYSNRDRLEDPQLKGGLMAAWRRGLQNEKTKQGPQS